MHILGEGDGITVCNDFAQRKLDIFQLSPVL